MALPSCDTISSHTINRHRPILTKVEKNTRSKQLAPFYEIPLKSFAIRHKKWRVSGLAVIQSMSPMKRNHKNYVQSTWAVWTGLFYSVCIFFFADRLPPVVQEEDTCSALGTVSNSVEIADYYYLLLNSCTFEPRVLQILRSLLFISHWILNVTSSFAPFLVCGPWLKRSVGRKRSSNDDYAGNVFDDWYRFRLLFLDCFIARDRCRSFATVWLFWLQTCAGNRHSPNTANNSLTKCRWNLLVSSFLLYSVVTAARSVFRFNFFSSFAQGSINKMKRCCSMCYWLRTRTENCSNFFPFSIHRIFLCIKNVNSTVTETFFSFILLPTECYWFPTVKSINCVVWHWWQKAVPNGHHRVEFAPTRRCKCTHCIKIKVKNRVFEALLSVHASESTFIHFPFVRHFLLTYRKSYLYLRLVFMHTSIMV